MATTTNFGWPTPDNTSYVRNGASDMRTLGSAIDTSMADLKGGTTGQVLKKNTNTDMDFVWAAESGGISPTILDAKGDLIGASAADTAARLAVGSDDQVLVADSSASTGLAWKSYGAQRVAGKNKILNGDFGIWQRGTSFSNPANNTYSADRWALVYDGSGASRTISQETFTPGSAPAAPYEGTSFLRMNVTSGGSGGSYFVLLQRMEDVRLFAGTKATVSFWAKANTNISFPVESDRYYGYPGGSATEYLSWGTANVTTSWQRFIFTLDVPSIAGKTIAPNSFLSVNFFLPRNTAFTLDIWGVQLEAGSVATPFTTATGNPATELAACQRYYWRTTSGSAYTTLCTSGYSLSTTAFAALIKMPVTMRIAPTAVDYSTLYIAQRTTTSADVVVTSATLGEVNQEVAQVTFSGSGGLTANHSGYIKSNNSASAYIGLSAEL